MMKLADLDAVAALLSRLAAGAPLTHGPLTVVPLLLDGALDPDWLTLDQAGEAVAVEEVGPAGAVPRLRVRNGADRDVLLLDGEELVGARQNRVLNTTVLVAAGSTVTIPVSCVEPGRWAYRQPRVTASQASLLASIRAAKATWVTESLKEGCGHESDQGQLWSKLADRASGYRVSSPTGAMRAIYERYEAELARAREALAPRPGQVGAIVFLAGRWVGLELLPGPGLFARAWARLCPGYAADTLGAQAEEEVEEGPGAGVAGPGEVSPAAALEALAGSTVEPAPAVAGGREYRLSGPVAGAVLVVEDRLAHLAAFPASG